MRQHLLRRCSRHATWAACGATALAASVLVGAGPRSAEAQLTYNGTTFVHGFASSPKIWQDGYPDLGGLSTPGYLAVNVALGTVGTPDLNDSLAFVPEVANLANFAASAGNTSVFVGHSMGGLAARWFYLNYPGQRGSVASIVAVNSPHQGAPLADNALSIKSFFFDVQRRVNAASRGTVRVYQSVGADLVGGVFALLGNGVASGFFVALGSILSFSNVGGAKQISVDDIAKLTSVPALADLRTSDSVVRRLNANTADAAVPRANVYGIIPFENAVYRLQAAMSTGDEDAKFRDLVGAKNFALHQFHICRAVGYFTIVNWGNARACGFGIRVLDRIDDQWARAANGTETVRMCLPFCFSFTRGRRVPFDGVVPNDHSNYPGLTDPSRQFAVPNANHFNVYQRRFSVNRVAQAMFSVGMRQAAVPRWDPVAGWLSDVAVGADGTVWGVNSNGNIGRWNGSSWDHIDGSFKQVSVGSVGQVWAVDVNGSVFHWNGGAWDHIDGWFKQVSVAADGTVWGVNDNGNVFRWNGGGWDHIDGWLSEVSVGSAGQVWGVNANGSVFRWNGGGWDGIPGWLSYVSVGADGTVWGVNGNGNVGSWNGSNWVQIDGWLSQVSVGSAGEVWGVNANGSVFRYSLRG